MTTLSMLRDASSRTRGLRDTLDDLFGVRPRPEGFLRDAVSASSFVPPTRIAGDGMVRGDEHTIVMTETDIRQEIRQYELQFGMTSDEFLRRVQEGTAPDTFESGLWKALLRYSR